MIIKLTFYNLAISFTDVKMHNLGGRLFVLLLLLLCSVVCR